jgi:hypothetical protein
MGISGQYSAYALQDIAPKTLLATGGRHPLDVTAVADDDEPKPWQRTAEKTQKLACPLPESVNVTLANQIYFDKSELPQPLVNKLIRLAAFQNPEFYKAQAMRLPVWNKPQNLRLQGLRNRPGHRRQASATD